MSDAEFPYPQPLKGRAAGCSPLLQWMIANCPVMSGGQGGTPYEDLGRPGPRTATVYPNPTRPEDRNVGADLYEWGANHTFLPSTKPQTLGWRRYER